MSPKWTSRLLVGNWYRRRRAVRPRQRSGDVGGRGGVSPKLFGIIIYHTREYTKHTHKYSNSLLFQCVLSTNLLDCPDMLAVRARTITERSTEWSYACQRDVITRSPSQTFVFLNQAISICPIFPYISMQYLINMEHSDMSRYRYLPTCRSTERFE